MIIETYSKSGTLWHARQYDAEKGADLARYVARNPYAWPGGYDLFVITDDGGLLCHGCCKSEYRQIRTAVPGDGWNVIAMGSVADLDCPEVCDHCAHELT